MDVWGVCWAMGCSNRPRPGFGAAQLQGDEGLVGLLAPGEHSRGLSGPPYCQPVWAALLFCKGCSKKGLRPRQLEQLSVSQPRLWCDMPVPFLAQREKSAQAPLYSVKSGWCTSPPPPLSPVPPWVVGITWDHQLGLVDF